MELTENKQGEQAHRRPWASYLIMVLTRGAFPCLRLEYTRCLGEANSELQVITKNGFIIGFSLL